MGREVPEVLKSGHHANIARWRRDQSLLRTLNTRPELLNDVVLDKKDKIFLENVKTACNLADDMIN